jgi:hypothetical protein
MNPRVRDRPLNTRIFEPESRYCCPPRTHGCRDGHRGPEAPE